MVRKMKSQRTQRWREKIKEQKFKVYIHKILIQRKTKPQIKKSWHMVNANYI